VDQVRWRGGYYGGGYGYRGYRGYGYRRNVAACAVPAAPAARERAATPARATDVMRDMITNS
jgi:hypothetical protein